MATTASEQMHKGRALQLAVYRQRDLLPYYGSSEIDRAMPFRANDFFSTSPTGFAVAPIGQPGTAALIVLQQLASIGPELRGKKLVISLSPITYHQKQRGYATNFSALHASSVVFSNELSLRLKKQIARRLMNFSGSLEKEPVLHFALRRLRKDSLGGDFVYWSSYPLGRLQHIILLLQDHWHSIRELQKQPPHATEVPKRGGELDWDSLMADAVAQTVASAGNHPFGFHAVPYLFPHLANKANPEGKYRETLRESTEWKDLLLLQQVLGELGAEPLFLSFPLNGPYLDSLGISRASRQIYYDRVRNYLRSFGFPLLDFAEHDADIYFTMDGQDHPSPKGWIILNRALDAFYHNRL